MVPFMEEKMVQLYGALNNECSWKDIKDRTQLSVKQFEEQLRAQFPSAVAVRTNIPLTPVSSSPNNLAASLIGILSLSTEILTTHQLREGGLTTVRKIS